MEQVHTAKFEDQLPYGNTTKLLGELVLQNASGKGSEQKREPKHPSLQHLRHPSPFPLIKINNGWRK
jgi:hypothetical protein